MALPINIDDLLNKRKVESNRIEFKKGWNPDKIYHTICAFANDFDNLGGGYVIVGVDEENGVAKRPVEGVSENQLDTIQRAMVGFNNKIEPYYMPRTEIEEIDGKYVFVIWVPVGVNRPYNVMESVVGKHSTPKWYIRNGSNSIEAKGEVLDELRNLATRMPFDMRGNPDIKEADIDFILLRSYLQNVGSRMVGELKQLDTMDVLERMDLLTGPTEQRIIKNVAAMIFCDHPDKFFPYTQISVVIFPEGKIQNPNRFTEKTFKDSVPTMIREVMSYLQSIAIQEYVIKPKDRMESIRYFNYPYQALEEAVVNAMYHRDYQEYQEVEITIEPNRISILSFSGPDRSIPAEAIKKCESLRSHRCRNNKLGDFLKELELTEGRGTGIPTIQDELAKNGSPRASIETNDERSYFLIDIPVHEGCESVIKLKDDAENNTQRQSNDRVTTEHDRVIQILKFCETPKTRRDILEQIGLKYHSDNFNKYIKPLVEQDLLLLTEPDSPNSPKQKYVTAEKK